VGSWETHYGEVAHQMVTRGDFISLWWPGSPIDPDVFWSKPVLTFWLMSLSMAAFGLVHPSPGTFACPAGLSGRCACPSASCRCWRWWACTWPCPASSVGARTPVGVGAGDFSHVQSGGQAGHDRHGLHRPMTMALALCALALFDDEDRELPRRRWRRFSWPHHATFYLTIGLLH